MYKDSIKKFLNLPKAQNGLQIPYQSPFDYGTPFGNTPQQQPQIDNGQALNRAFPMFANNLNMFNKIPNQTNVTPRPTPDEFNLWNNAFNRQNGLQGENPIEINNIIPGTEIVPEVDPSTPTQTQANSFSVAGEGLNLLDETTQSSIDQRYRQDPYATQRQQLNIFNPYGQIDAISALAYGAYQSGQGNSGQAALGFGRGLLGALRTGLSAYGAGRNNRQLLEGQNNQPVVTSQYLQDGGRVNVAQFLSGKYITDSSNPTVEIEKNEQVLNAETGIVQKAIGETHENGGIKTNLPPGSQVLSDHTKIGAKTAKELSKELDIKLKAGDTYAKALEKYSTKIGLNKLIKKEEDLTKKTEESLQSEDNDTKEVNLQFLQEEFASLEQEKEDINNKQAEAFQELFQRQEKEKDINIDQDYMQRGGTITVDSKNDPRYQAYQDSLVAYNLGNNMLSVAQQQVGKQGIESLRKVIDANSDFLEKYPNADISGLKPIKKIPYSARDKSHPQGALPFTLNSGANSFGNIPIYKKPVQQVKYVPQPPREKEESIQTPSSRGLQVTPQELTAPEIEIRNDPQKIYAVDRFQNSYLAQGNPPGNYQEYQNRMRNNPNALQDVNMVFLKDPATLGIERGNDGRYARWNESYNNLIEGEDFIYTNPPQMQEGGTIDPQQIFAQLLEQGMSEEEALAYMEQGQQPDILSQVRQMIDQGAEVEEITSNLLQAGYTEDEASQMIQQATSQEIMQAGGTTRERNIEEFYRNVQEIANSKGLTPPTIDTSNQKSLGKNWTELQNWLVKNAPDEVVGYFKQAPLTNKGMRNLFKNYGKELKALGVDTKRNPEDFTPEERLNIQKQVDTGRDFILDQFADGKVGYRYPLSGVTAQTAPTTVSMNPSAPLMDRNYYQPQVESNVAQPQDNSGIRNVIPMFPIVEDMPPSAALIPRNDQVRFNRMNPVTRTPEASIAAINSQTNFLNEQAFLNNPNIAPFLTANTLASTQGAVNRAIAETDTYNAEAIGRVNAYNLQADTKEQLTNIDLANNYEKRLFSTLSNQEADWRRFFTNRQLQNKQNWMDVNNLNLNNAMFDNFQSDGSNIYFQNPTTYQNQNDSFINWYRGLTPEEQLQYRDSQL